MMKIAVLGGTGRTGKLVVDIALEKGYEVNCLVRDRSQLVPTKGLTLVEGVPNASNTLEKLMEGCSALINILNVSRTNDFPWAPLRAPENLISDAMHRVTRIASDSGTERIISCSAWGVHETKKDLPFWFRLLIDKSNIGPAYADHERQETILENSAAAWTIVRPVGLTNSPALQLVQESFANTPKPQLTISRATLAKYLVSCIENEALIHKKVVISKK